MPLTAFILVWCPFSFGQDNAGGTTLGIVGPLNLYPVLPGDGDDVVIGVLVGNNGQKDARDVPVYFYEDGVYFDKVLVDIRASDTAYVETNWTADSGDSYLSVVVDPDQEHDQDAHDNSVGTWVTVP